MAALRWNRTRRHCSFVCVHAYPFDSELGRRLGSAIPSHNGRSVSSGAIHPAFLQEHSVLATDVPITATMEGAMLVLRRGLSYLSLRNFRKFAHINVLLFVLPVFSPAVTVTVAVATTPAPSATTHVELLASDAQSPCRSPRQSLSSHRTAFNAELSVVCRNALRKGEFCRKRQVGVCQLLTSFNSESI